MVTTTGNGGQPPRADDAVSERIIAAVLDELAEGGLVNLSTDRIAKRARASKASVYNRWRTKQELVLAAFRQIVRPFRPIDTGSLRGDIDVLWQGTLAGASNPRYHATMAELIGASATDLALRNELEGLQRSFLGGIRGILERARERGELPDDVAVELLAETVQALTMHRVFVSYLPIDTLRASIDQLIFHSPPRRS